jgi:hypothetical protein
MTSPLAHIYDPSDWGTLDPLKDDRNADKARIATGGGNVTTEKNSGHYYDQINDAYQKTFGRPAETGGLNYWSEQLSNGGVTDIFAAIKAGAKDADIVARNDIAAGGVDTSKTWGNGATFDKTLKYDAENNTWGTAPPKFYQNNYGIEPPVMETYKRNPYLDDMASGIASQISDNWNRNIAPGIRSGAQMVGGYGGSRQGVVEANGLNDMNRSLAQNLTNLYGQDYTNDRNRALQKYGIDGQNYSNDRNRALQKYGIDANYNLGMASNNLGYANLDSNNAQFGANLALNTMNNMANWANSGVAAGTTIQDTPARYFGNFSGNTNAIGRLGGTSSQTAQGDPISGAIGGGLLGGQIAKNWPF